MRRAAQSSPYAGLGHPEGLGTAPSAVTQVPAASPHSIGQGPEHRDAPSPPLAPLSPSPTLEILSHLCQVQFGQESGVLCPCWPHLFIWGGGVEVGGALEPPGP